MQEYGYYGYSDGSSGYLDDLEGDMDDLSIQQHMRLMDLPGPCLQRLAALLPSHRSIVLRQCSKALQQLVDAVEGVALVFHGKSSDAQHAVALKLSAAKLTRLDTSEISNKAPAQELLRAVSEVAGGLPQLQQLTCNIEQLELLNAVAAVSPQLSAVTLDSQQDWPEGAAEKADAPCEEQSAKMLQTVLPGGRASHVHAVCSVRDAHPPVQPSLLQGLLCCLWVVRLAAVKAERMRSCPEWCKPSESCMAGCLELQLLMRKP